MSRYEILKEILSIYIPIRLGLATIWCYMIYHESGIFTACFAFLVALTFELESILRKLQLKTTELQNDILGKIVGIKNNE